MILRGLFVVPLVWLLTSKVFALDLFDLQNQSTSSLSLSGATTATATDFSALSTNPAGISRHSESRLIGVDNRYFKKGRNWGLGVGVIDGVTEDPLHWAFHINTVHTRELEMDQYTFGTSYNHNDILLIGVSHRLTKFHPALSIINDGLYYSLGAGILALVSDHISLGLGGQNLFRSERYGSILPSRVVGGMAANFMTVRGDIDLERNLSNENWVLKSGVEYKVSDAITFKVGWNQNLTHEDKGYSLGNSISIVDRLNLDFGFLDQLNSSIITISGGFSVKI